MIQIASREIRLCVGRAAAAVRAETKKGRLVSLAALRALE